MARAMYTLLALVAIFTYQGCGGGAAEPVATSAPPAPVDCKADDSGKKLEKKFTFFEEKKNYRDARVACCALGGDLASIRSAQENKQVQDVLKDTAWIGFTDLVTEGTFLWDDGFPVEYTNWNENEPNDWDHKTEREDCTEIRMDDGLWNDHACVKREIGYVCRIASTPDPEPVDCKADDSGNTLEAKFTFFEEKKNYRDARVACCALGGDLASIRSEEENAEVLALIGENNAQIGFTDLATEGTFAWDDGTEVDYTNWNDKEPNDWDHGSEREDCTVITKGGGWNDIPCTKWTTPYVCRSDTFVPAATTAAAAAATTASP